MSNEPLLRRLGVAKTNDARWRIFFATTNVCIQDRVLYCILQNSQDNVERWRVFDNTFHKDLQEKALIAILIDATFRGDLKQMWLVHECASPPELKALAQAYIYLLEHLPGNTTDESIKSESAQENVFTNENVLHREAKFAKVLSDPTASPSSLYEVFFYTVSDSRKRQAFLRALKQKPVTM